MSDLRIWKDTVSVLEDTVISMPDNAQILHVREQNDEVCMWAIGDTTGRLVDRVFTVIGTGHQCPIQNSRYVGTAFTENGTYVWHVFEVTS